MSWTYLLFASVEKIFFNKDLRISTIIIQKIKSASFASSFVQSLILEMAVVYYTVYANYTMYL